MQCLSKYVNKIDLAIILLCYTPACMVAYACCYLMLVHAHPDDKHEYIKLSAYGCLQSIIGYTSGYFTARWFHCRHLLQYPNVYAAQSMGGEAFTNHRPVEEIPLLSLAAPPPATISSAPPVGDTEEALEA